MEMSCEDYALYMHHTLLTSLLASQLTPSYSLEATTGSRVCSAIQVV